MDCLTELMFQLRGMHEDDKFNVPSTTQHHDPTITMLAISINQIV